MPDYQYKGIPSGYTPTMGITTGLESFMKAFQEAKRKEREKELQDLLMVGKIPSQYAGLISPEQAKMMSSVGTAEREAEKLRMEGIYKEALAKQMRRSRESKEAILRNAAADRQSRWSINEYNHWMENVQDYAKRHPIFDLNPMTNMPEESFDEDAAIDYADDLREKALNTMKKGEVKKPLDKYETMATDPSFKEAFIQGKAEAYLREKGFTTDTDINKVLDAYIKKRK